jgi:hypothetical protein
MALGAGRRLRQIGGSFSRAAPDGTEVAIPRNLFADIVRLIAEHRAPPRMSTA